MSSTNTQSTQSKIDWSMISKVALMIGGGLGIVIPAIVQYIVIDNGNSSKDKIIRGMNPTAIAGIIGAVMFIAGFLWYAFTQANLKISYLILFVIAWLSLICSIMAFTFSLLNVNLTA